MMVAISLAIGIANTFLILSLSKDLYNAVVDTGAILDILKKTAEEAEKHE
jgi:hypothetical protein